MTHTIRNDRSAGVSGVRRANMRKAHARG
ncbi:hypothetical protein STRTUCAR8_06084, partial [Streptomyces turgidiscabies Car8]